MPKASSITYRVAGLLDNVKRLISARSRPRESMLDAQHDADIEFVSPNFINSRSLSSDDQFIAKRSRKTASDKKTLAEDVVFDKAEEAASVKEIRAAIELDDAEISVIENEDFDWITALQDRLKVRKGISHLWKQSGADPV